MEKLFGKNIINFFRSKINCYTKIKKGNKSNNKKIKAFNNQESFNQCEKLKLGILYQIRTGRKFY